MRNAYIYDVKKEQSYKTSKFDKWENFILKQNCWFVLQEGQPS